MELKLGLLGRQEGWVLGQHHIGSLSKEPGVCPEHCGLSPKTPPKFKYMYFAFSSLWFGTEMKL